MIQEITSFSKSLLSFQNNLAQLLQEVFPDLDQNKMNDVDNNQEIRFKCRCSKERSLSALKLLGDEEWGSIINEDEKAEVRCHFCNNYYHISKDELISLLRNKWGGIVIIKTEAVFLLEGKELLAKLLIDLHLVDLEVLIGY